MGIVELKKKRTDDRLDPTYMGLNTEIIMNADDVNETIINYESLGNSLVPKKRVWGECSSECSSIIMNLISWNYRGLGTPCAFQLLKEITLQKRPDFIFLHEVICRKDTAERFQRAVGFEGMMVVESQGRSGV